MTRLPLLIPALGAFLVSCSDQPVNESSGKIEVVTTIAMIGDVAREVAGPLAEVRSLIGEGIDPHLYKPTAQDVKALQAADLIFYNGLMLEGKMTDVLVRIAAGGKPVHAVTEELSTDSGFVLDDGGSHDDPHVWMDVKGWQAATNAIAKAFGALDPPNARTYETNAANYLDRLTQLDQYAASSIASIPEGQRVLVTAHDAFQYLSRAYGIEVRGVQGFSTESEAGIKDIENLVSFLVSRKIPAVFVESSVSDKNVRALIEGCAAQGHTVVIGGELFSDAMGATGTYEGTYIGMIDHNITTITRALGGTAPEQGFQGKLSASHP